MHISGWPGLRTRHRPPPPSPAPPGADSQEGSMTRRLVGLLLLSAAAGCGSGRLVPSESPEPSYAPSDPAPMSEPAPAAQPTPQAAAPAPPRQPRPRRPRPPVTPTPPAMPHPGMLRQPVTPRMAASRSRSAGSVSTAPAGSLRRPAWSSGTTAPTPASGPPWAAERGPAVDFSRDIVIVAAAGQRATGGNAIAVERVNRTGDGLAVEVVETNPGPGCMTSPGADTTC